MKRKFAFAFIATISLLLSGCGLPKSLINPKFDKETFAQDGHSYIVISASNSARVVNFFLFENENGNKFQIYLGGARGVMVPAGNYKLRGYWISGSSTRNNETVNVSLDFSSYIEASFNAPAGKAIYLGKVETIIDKSETKIFNKFFSWRADAGDLKYESTVKDDFANLKPEVKAGFEKISGVPLEKSLLNWNKKTAD